MTTDFLIMRVVCGLSAVNFGVLAVIAYRGSADVAGYAVMSFCATVAVAAAAVAILVRQADEKTA